MNDIRLTDVGKWDGVTLSRELKTPYEDASQADVPFGAISYFLSPWHSYMGTMKAADFLNILGIVHNGRIEETDAVFKLLSEAGIKKVRTEVAWHGFEYDDDTKLKNYKQQEFDILFDTFKKYGIRPLILFNANEGLPTPYKEITVHLTQDAKQGDRYVHIADASQIIPKYTGFMGLDGKGCYPIITAIDQASKRLELSAPLPKDVAAGITTLLILKYIPIGASKNADGTANLDTENTLNGWGKYVKTVSDMAKAKLELPGDAGFDIEVWNEYTFGSSWLDLNNYYSPGLVYPEPRIVYPKKPRYTNQEVLLPITIDYVRNTANLPKTKVISGFSNQRPWENGKEMDMDEWGYSRHYYTGYGDDSYILAGNPNIPSDTRYYLNALGERDGKVAPNGQTEQGTIFIPSHVSAHPERWFNAYQTEYVTRDVLPFHDPTDVHGRYASPGNGKTAEFWMSEVNLWRHNFMQEIAQATGVSFADDPSIQAISDYIGAKIMLRHYTFFSHKGMKALFIYCTKDEYPGFGTFSYDFFKALEQNSYVLTPEIENKVGPSLNAIKNVYTIMKTGIDIDSPRKLKVEKVVEYKPRWVFRGDGTPEHPDRYHADDMAVLPFQLSDHRFAIGYYVVTRDIRHHWDTSRPLLDMNRYAMPEQDFDLTISNLCGTNPYVFAYDPLTNSNVPVSIVTATPTSITVKVKTVDYPRFLIIQEDKTGPLIQQPLLQKTETGGVLTFTPTTTGSAEIVWGKHPVRKPSLFIEKRFSDEQWTQLAETREVTLIDFEMSLPAVKGSWEWTGQIIPNHSEEYTYILSTDNGDHTSLYVGQTPVITGVGVTRGKIYLSSGVAYDLTLRYSTPYFTAHTVKLFHHSASEPTNFVIGNANVEQKITTAVTAGRRKFVPINGLKEGDAVKLTISDTNGLYDNFPLWDWDVQATLYNVTPFFVGPIPEDDTAATDIILSTTTVAQSAGLNGLVGTLTTVDAGSGPRSYALVSGEGDIFNAKFHIVGDQLRINEAASLAPGTYSVRIETTDGTHAFSKAFAINVVDDIPPTFLTGSPAIVTTTPSQAVIKVSLNEQGNVYYVVLPESAPVPTANQVKAGHDGSDLPAFKSGNVNISTASVDHTVILTGLSENTSYSIYLVAHDSASNSQTTVTKLEVTTPSNIPHDDTTLTFSEN